MKGYYGILFTLICMLLTPVFASYKDFSHQLETMGIEVKTIEKQEKISRYELARLLNAVECKDCINPEQTMIQKYTQEFRKTFTTTPGKDFKDIQYKEAKYNNVSYYYCVAYVGDQEYMRGYPQATSPICGGQFCGTKNTTTAEFLQVIINILSKYIYKDLYLNRKQANNWVNGLKTESYEAKTFTTQDKQLLTEKSTTCDTICALQNQKEVNLYLKYCMFNLKACNMQEIGKIKQGYWPIAELNLLAKQNIINIDQTLRKNIDKPIDGKTVLETLFKLNSKINCTFNNDYDCDGIENNKDICPNTYNPHQKDLDKDGIGDVCDDDIDGDGIKNPIGIVDDEGNIDIAKWIENTDNCLFIINPDQQDNNHNIIGDVCENNNNTIGIYIEIKHLEGIAPLTTTFIAKTAGQVDEIFRDFGDGTQGKGKEVTHTFLSPGMYNVQAIAKQGSNEAKAQIIVIIGGQQGDNTALQTRVSRIGGKSTEEIIFSTLSIGTFDIIEWYFPKENTSIKTKPGETIKKLFKKTGEHLVIVKGYTNNKLVGISTFTIGSEEGRGALLKSNTNNPEINQKILLNTDTYNIRQEDIVKVEWDFGDGIKKINSTLTMEYAYNKRGKYVITQTITLIDNKKLTNMITINVIDKTMFSSYALLMIPDKLIASLGEKINFSVNIIGKLIKTPINQIMEFADGNIQIKPGTEKMPTMFSHIYQKNGILMPQNRMHIDQCNYLRNQATIAIQGNDICLDAKIKNTIGTYKCDLDKDNIPDICDTDIDGDGIPNLLGLINKENNDCSYQNNPKLPKTNLNQDVLAKHYKNICSLDNAPFAANPDQLDLNQNGIGDIQETLIIYSDETIDTDKDGIPNITDVCPIIQETRNNIKDEDGCPEIGQEIGCTSIIETINDRLIVQPTTCNQCPCQFGDFSSDITNNDQIRAILWDKKKTIQYKLSLPWIVNFNK